MIELTCPHCGATARARDGAAGRQAACPTCGRVFTIQSDSTSGRAAARPPAPVKRGRIRVGLLFGAAGLLLVALVAGPLIYAHRGAGADAAAGEAVGSATQPEDVSVWLDGAEIEYVARAQLDTARRQGNRLDDGTWPRVVEALGRTIIICQERKIGLTRSGMVRVGAVVACGPMLADDDIEGLALWLALGYGPDHGWPGVWDEAEAGPSMVRSGYDDDCKEKRIILSALRREYDTWRAGMKGNRPDGRPLECPPPRP